MHATRRDLLIGLASAAAIPAVARAQRFDVVTPEMFGAKGDGRTNDTDAFAALSDHVNALGGGTIVLRPVTYIVGRAGDRRNSAQDSRTGLFGFPPARIMRFANCTGPLVIQGNGARLRAAPGLRFGAFDPRTGQRLDRALPFTDREFRAAPYIAMIEAIGCSGLVEIGDLELDGNLGALEVGGKWGDTGWQVPGTGIRLIGNSGPERLSRITTHHHPLDGLTITGPNARAASSVLSQIVAESNGRQGCSLTGGRNYLFAGCRFDRTGRAGISSGPGAGVDIEAEGNSIVRDIRFTGCRFSDNAGPGMIADSGGSAGVTFEHCTFVGTTHWSAWPNKPNFRFDDCTFVGTVVRAFGDADASRAAVFRRCSFRDDPALSPTRQVYGGGHSSRPIVLLPDQRNVQFDACEFALTHECALPITSEAIYSDCRMSQRSLAPSRPLGTYRGTTTVIGNASLAGATIRGDVILNGRRLARTA